MAIFVNYYPCSYGDSLVAMFSGKKIQRQYNLIIPDTDGTELDFKELDFYQKDTTSQQQILHKLDNSVHSCHRQSQFDFSPHKVISVILDFDDFLPKRFNQIHLIQKGKTFSNDQVLKLQHKYSVEQLVKLDYTLWNRSNVLPTDVLLPLSLIHNSQKLREFCKIHDLDFDQDQLDEITNDMKQYQ